MKILLDENLPESLLAALRRLGHQVDSVNSLRLKGIDNGALYRLAAQAYDLCFTKDAEMRSSPLSALYARLEQQDGFAS